jgi:hypothetical protein
MKQYRQLGSTSALYSGGRGFYLGPEISYHNGGFFMVSLSLFRQLPI